MSIRRLAVGIVMLLAGLLAGSRADARPAGAAGGYPRLGLYGSIHGNGSPYWAAPADTTMDAALLDQIARYDFVIIDVNPITPYRPAFLDELRHRNPDIRVVAYITAGYSWPVEDPDSANHVPTRYRHLVRNLGGFLYNSVDGSEFPGTNINLAKRDANGRFVVAEGIADLFASAILGGGPWDGMFLDVFCSDLAWMQDATHRIDYVRAGYPSLAALETAWAAATDTLARRLRREAPPGAILVGNCGTSNHHDVLNGWMRENFPYQSGGTWYTNVIADPHGYLADDRDYQATSHNQLFSIVVGGASQPYSATNTHRVRYGLASAALGSGYAPFGPSDRNSETAPYHTWWYDEYAVDLVTGHTATDLAHTHWLGMPRTGPFQMIWAGTNTDAVTNPEFETSLAGWNFGVFAPATATLTRDASTAASGATSAHVAIATPGVNPWDVNLATTQTLAMSAGGTYAATFWVKASAPRTITVTATLLAGGELASRPLAVDTAWQHVQVILQPASSANAVLEFFMGQQAGDVWFDDVHFQQGSTSIWRRDFDNGIVLVNPSSSALSVPLGGTFRRILGTADPAVNDGTTLTTATVPAGDGLFLIRTTSDSIPPANIQDARVLP